MLAEKTPRWRFTETAAHQCLCSTVKVAVLWTPVEDWVQKEWFIDMKNTFSNEE